MGGSICAIVLYQMRNKFILPRLTSEIMIRTSILLGSILGIICFLAIKQHAQKVYAEQIPYNPKLLDIPALIKNARKLNRIYKLCFLMCFLAIIASVWIAGQEPGNLFFFFVGTLIVFLTVFTLPFYQPRRRKKAIAIMKEWNNSMI